MLVVVVVVIVVVIVVVVAGIGPGFREVQFTTKLILTQNSRTPPN